MMSPLQYELDYYGNAVLCRLILFRHGETDFNAAGKYQGQSFDEPLNNTGVMQSYQLLELFEQHAINLDCVVSSPARRATETTDPLCRKRKIPLIIDHNWQEVNFGIGEGRKKSEIPASQIAAHYDFYNDFFCWTNGESRIDAKKRALAAVRNAVNNIRPQGLFNIGISCHGSLLGNLIAMFSQGINTNFLANNCYYSCDSHLPQKWENLFTTTCITRMNRTEIIPLPKNSDVFVMELARTEYGEGIACSFNHISKLLRHRQQCA